jgi:hypothetical protein
MPSGGCRSDEDAGRALIVEPGLEHSAFGGKPNPDADLVSRHQRRDQLTAPDGTLHLRQRKRRRQCQ